MFQDIKTPSERRLQFTLSPTSYPYANTLRRAIMTLVPGVAFRSDTSDIKIGQNSSTTQPNELLAHRISLIPIHGVDPATWDPDRYVFRIKVTNEEATPRDVMASDIQVLERRQAADMSETLIEVPNRTFFVPHTLTRDTCLITTLPGKRSLPVTLEAEMRATVGTGREHTRFMPTCQASYGYTLDVNTDRRNAYFERWLVRSKNVDPESLKQDETRRQELDREFKTMEIQRIYKVDEKGEPNSFDFQIESVGPIGTRAIVERALAGLVSKICEPFVGLDQGDLPEMISTVASDAQLVGFDFVIQGQDHTFGNMIQTWLVENHVEGDATPRITFAGYKIPHPLKDEMLLRIGVEDGNEMTARAAIAAAARGCKGLFQTWHDQWASGASSTQAPITGQKPRRTIKLKQGV